MDNQRCTQCPAVLPISKFSKHLELKHGDITDKFEKWKSDEEFDFGDDEMDYDLDDDDVKAFQEKICDSLMDKEGSNVEHQRALCPMCSESVGIQVMTRHLATEHHVRVVSPPDWADLSEDPDFLESKKKEKCHHCQSEFNSSKELDDHIEESHGKGCKVCGVQRLVRDKRLFKMKPSQTNTNTKSAYRGNIISGENLEIISDYSDFYPADQVETCECEQCESPFCWASPDHSCSLTDSNLRIVAGERLEGRIITGEMAATQDKQLQYFSSQRAQSLVEKLAEEVKREEREKISAEMKILLEDIIDNLVEGREVPAQSIEARDQLSMSDFQLQLSGQILCYRSLRRQEGIPDLALRAARHPQLFSGSLNERRKLNSFMLEEYKEDIEELRREEFLKRAEEKKQLKKEALREMNRIKTYDYSRYVIPNIEANKKPKIQMKPSVGAVRDLNRSNPRLLKNFPNPQQKIGKFPNENSVLKVGISGTPTRILQQSSRLPAKMGSTKEKRTIVVQSPSRQPEQMPRKLPPGPPLPLPLQAQPTAKPLTTLERLQSLGLSVSISGSPVEEKPSQISPGGFEKTPPLARTMIVKKIVSRRPSVVGKPADKKISIPTVGQTQRIKNKTKTPSKSETKVATTINKVNKKMSSGVVLSNQKLLLKSQILAYRMLRRKENLPEIVFLAATKINFRELEISKNDQKSLKQYFAAEYR